MGRPRTYQYEELWFAMKLAVANWGEFVLTKEGMAWPLLKYIDGSEV
ncbi:MAG: hypothetical protein AAF585_10230 [Verrucomicrobiota bacterium]